MFRKNTAGQFVCFQLVKAADGTKGTGITVAVRRCIDGTFGDGGGTVTEDGTTGSYKYAMAQADTNGNDISLIFSGTGAIPLCINFVTTAADPTDGVHLGLTALPNAAAGASGGLPTGDSAGKVALQADQAVNATKINGTTQTAGDVVSVANAIKTQTDKMAFTVTNQIDANMLDVGSSSAPTVNFAKTIEAVGRGTVTTGATTTSVPTSALTIGAGATASGIVANQFAGRVVLFDGATTTAGLRGTAATISANTASDTPTLTVGTLPATPASGDTFSII